MHDDGSTSARLAWSGRNSACRAGRTGWCGRPFRRGVRAEEFQRLVAAGLEAKEREKQAELGPKGFLGRRRVLAQSPFARPAPGEPRRQLNPRIAARDRWKRIEAIASRVVGFLVDYGAALKARRAGMLDVVFPAGTYQLRVEHGVRCAPA